MQAALAAAKATDAKVSEREASQLAFFDKLLTGELGAALVAAAAHVETWPRDAAVMNHYPTIVGLISQCGPPGSKRRQADIMDAFAPDYGDDWWYAGHRAMALSEVGRFDEAYRQLATWMRDGKLHCRETVIEGIEKTPEAYAEMMEGRGIGKVLVKVA